MAEQGDEIKNLFTKLGLDPTHYQQIRASTDTAAGKPPPRWTLLQPVTSPIQPVVIAPAPAPVVVPAAVAAPAPPPPRKPEPLPPDAMALSSLSAALLGAAQDIVRAETAAQPELEEESEPSALASALSQVSPAEGLQSLFRSVKESQAAVYQPKGTEEAPTERPTVRLPGEVLKVASRPAAGREATQTLQKPLREMPPPRSASRLGPKPGVTVRLDPVTTPVVPTAVEGRLRFSAPMPAPETTRGEPLSDVFRRLSRRP